MKAFLLSAWAWTKSAARTAFNYVVHHPLAAAATVFLVVAAVACLAAGKTFQIGGLLQKLWGTKPPADARGTVAEARVDADGKPIAPGVSDDRGFVQAPVSTEILAPTIFSDPSTVTVVHPDKGKVVIELPTGVKNTDVKEVVEVAPSIYEIRNNDKGVRPSSLDDVIKKAGG